MAGETLFQFAPVRNIIRVTFFYRKRGWCVTRLWMILLPIAVAAGLWVWAADIVNLQGERTIYTAGCVNGKWEGDQCSGKLVAAERFRFRALKAHSEVFFWNVGVASDPSGKFSQCVIANGRNWVCKPNADGPKSITLELARGKPVRDTTGQTRPCHPVSKWTWTLLDYGLYWGQTAPGP